MRAAALALPLLLAGCAHLLPVWLHPVSPECPGALDPVESFDPALHLQVQYRRTGQDGSEDALLLVAERQEHEIVLAGFSALGTHLFTVVQEGTGARPIEHLRPLYPHPPEDVLRDLHRALRRGAVPGEVIVIEPPGCDYRATLTIH